MVNLSIYVEGGGSGGELRSRCRKAFAELTKKLFKNTELERKNPKYVACGSRNEAFDMFCIAIEEGKPCLLLVDSEAPVSNQSPWKHLSTRSNDSSWSKPSNADDAHCHLMVQCMEAWLIADKEALKSYYGDNFHPDRLPGSNNVESIDKQQLYTSLESASRDTTKGKYGKGEHSFDLLGRIDPEKVRQASPWADRFFKELYHRLQNL